MGGGHRNPDHASRRRRRRAAAGPVAVAVAVVVCALAVMGPIPAAEAAQDDPPALLTTGAEQVHDQVGRSYRGLLDQRLPLTSLDAALFFVGAGVVLIISLLSHRDHKANGPRAASSVVDGAAPVS